MDEAFQPVDINGAVGMRDKRPSDAIDAWKASQRPLRELGKFTVIVGGEILADFPNLLLHDVEIVEKPLAGRGNLVAGLRRLGQHSKIGDQPVRIFLEAAAKGFPNPCRPANRLRFCETFGVLFKALGTEQFGPDRQIQCSQ